jgi:hypothetical protein
VIRVPLSRHTISETVLTVELSPNNKAVRLSPGEFLPFREMTAGEARYLAEALIDAAGRIEATA